MFADVRYAGADEGADPRNDGKDQRDEKDDLAWCIQSGHVSPPLYNKSAHTICLWLSGLRAKQGMRPLLAHEVRPCLIYGEFSEVDRRAVSSL
jgi:hypothetical protein